jgi:hypothetical protein
MRRIASLLLLAPALVLTAQGCMLDLCTDFPGACEPAGQGGSGGSGGDATTTTGTSGGGMGGAGGGGGEGGGVVVPPDCDPRELGDDATIDASCGVFVYPRDNQTMPAGSTGTKTAPYRDLTNALADNPDGKPIFVCTGADPIDEAFVLDSSVVLFGGFVDCENWVVGAPTARSPWTAPAGEVPLKVVGNTTNVVLSRFAITAQDAVGLEADGQGKSSIALWVDAASVDVDRCELRAGDGVAGAEGESPPMAMAPAPNGDNGANGCIDGMNKSGGSGGVNVCVDTDGNMVNVSGGLGGTGTATANGGSGDPGEPNPDGTPPDGGAGGKRQDGTGCGPGGGGQSGTNADAAATPPTDSAGLLSAEGYRGPSPADGKRGNPGTGAGGGGGARQCVVDMMTRAGPGGGGGGAGGCGGVGGKGGAAGGASIALFAVNASNISLSDVLLAAAAGGQGGRGALGQEGQLGGGAGGVGGLPGTGTAGAAACIGGQGGQGGQGGPGAGGAGGVSALIALGAGATVNRTGSTSSDVLGTAGAAGPAATGGNPGIPGFVCGTLVGATWTCQ